MRFNGDKLRQAIFRWKKRTGGSQVELCEQIGIPYTRLSNAMKSNGIAEARLRKLCDIIGINIAEVTDMTDVPDGTITELAEENKNLKEEVERLKRDLHHCSELLVTYREMNDILKKNNSK